MLKYIVRRLLGVIPVLLGLSLILFAFAIQSITSRITSGFNCWGGGQPASRQAQIAFRASRRKWIT